MGTLTDAEIRAFKPAAKNYRKAAGRSLYLEVTKDGRKIWRVRFRSGEKDTAKTIGEYPRMTLKQAREVCELMMNANAANVVKGRSFEVVAREFLRMQSPRRRSMYEAEQLRRLERDIFPEIGKLPVAGITPPQLLEVLRKVEARGVGTLPGRLRNLLSQVFRFGIAAGDCEHDPARDIAPALKAPPPVRHQPCIKTSELPALIRAIRSYPGLEDTTRLGLLLMLHVFVRSQELCKARWDEVDLKAKLWVVGKERTKQRKEHVVPLSPEAVALFKELKRVSGDSPFVLPCVTNPLAPMSGNTMLFALYRMNYRTKMSVHGFRSVASSTLNEHREAGLIPWSADVIELCLSHELPGGSVRAAYNRAQLLDQRRQLMEYWSRYLSSLEVAPQLLEVAYA